MEVPTQTLYINNINEKIKKPVLKKLLYMVFSQYGKVIQIVACKGIKLRGQAWVVFQDTSAATNALKGKQGFVFHDKPMKIAFSKDKSDIVAKKEGITVPVRAAKRAREPAPKAAPADASTEEDGQGPAKKANIIINNNPPHKILFAQNLPLNCSEQMLRVLFQSCSGLMDMRIVPGNKGMAFIEFRDEVASGMALRQMNGFQLNETSTLHLSFSN
jgi:U2 small nuclear ribonucleoprotein B''